MIASIKSYMRIVCKRLHGRVSVRHLQFQSLRLAKSCETRRKQASYRRGDKRIVVFLHLDSRGGVLVARTFEASVI